MGMEACGQESGKPTMQVKIDDCGELKDGRRVTHATSLQQPGIGSLKRKRAADAPTEVHVIHILKKHTGSREPTCWRGQEVKCTKGRATLALTNMRRRLQATSAGGARELAFVELAREHSDCESAKKGGDLGRVALGVLEPAVLEDVAFSLAVGEVSEAFESQEGIHMVLRA